jgi:hypothetical protein
MVGVVVVGGAVLRLRGSVRDAAELVTVGRPEAQQLGLETRPPSRLRHAIILKSNPYTTRHSFFSALFHSLGLLNLLVQIIGYYMRFEFRGNQATKICLCGIRSDPYKHQLNFH